MNIKTKKKVKKNFIMLTIFCLIFLGATSSEKKLLMFYKSQQRVSNELLGLRKKYDFLEETIYLLLDELSKMTSYTKEIAAKKNIYKQQARDTHLLYEKKADECITLEQVTQELKKEMVALTGQLKQEQEHTRFLEKKLEALKTKNLSSEQLSENFSNESLPSGAQLDNVQLRDDNKLETQHPEDVLYPLEDTTV